MSCLELNSRLQDVVEIRIPIASLVRGKSQTFEIPDYRDRQLVVSEVHVIRYQVNESEDQLYPIELKLLSNSSPIMSFTRTFLRRTNGKMEFKDSRALEASGNLSLQIKSPFTCKEIEIAIKYREHPGIPVYQTEQALSGLDESHTNFWAALVREIRKVTVTKIEFIPNVCHNEKREIKLLTIVDPYIVTESNSLVVKSYKLELERNDVGVFAIDRQCLPSVQDLLRAKLECYDEEGKCVLPNEVGIIVYGFP